MISVVLISAFGTCSKVLKGFFSDVYSRVSSHMIILAVKKNART